MSVLEHSFASKLFCALREAHSEVYADNKVLNETIRRLVTIFQNTRLFVFLRGWRNSAT
jgi:hypothetical protein